MSGKSTTVQTFDGAKSLREQIYALCGTCLSDEADDATWFELDALVVARPEARRYYVDYMLDTGTIHRRSSFNAANGKDAAPEDCKAAPSLALNTMIDALQLAELSQEDREAEARGPSPVPAAASPRWGMHVFHRPWSVSFATASIVVVVLVAILATIAAPGWRAPRDIGKPSPIEPAPFIARISDLRNAAWGDEQEWRTGAHLRVGDEIDLQAGLVTLAFNSGARVALEGPARFRVENENRGSLRRGSLVARVPAQAVGFTVETPTARVVDLGTEFGVWIDEAGECEVHLIAGAVEVTALDDANAAPVGQDAGETVERGAGQQTQRLRVGESVRVTPREGIRPIEPANERFAAIARQLQANGGRLVYNLQRDFSTTENTETSVWSYRYKEGFERDGNYPLLPNFSANAFNREGLAAWILPSSGDLNPSIFKNNSGRELTLGNPVHAVNKPGWLVMHPGEKQLVVATWTAPEAGTVGIRFKLSSIHFAVAGVIPTTHNNGIEWFVDKGAETLDSGGYDRFQNSGMRSLNDVQVAAGERIHFIVDPKSGFHESDGTQVFVEIRYAGPPQAQGLGDEKKQ